MRPATPPAFRRGPVAAAAAIALIAVVATAPVWAQNTTSGINGIVTTPDGKPVAGATVTIVHVESGSTSTVATDAAGRYSARGLRAGGPYTVTISQGGRTEKRDGLFLSLAETFSYDAQLSTSTQVITVTGRGVSDKFNSSNMGTGTNLGARELATSPSISRNLQELARSDPRLSQTDAERGEITAVGQNTRYNSITIDGVTINDTFGLEANNLPTRKQPISIEAIQAVQVNVSNYDVTQKGYTGANINAVTKSGTNEFKGSLYYVWRDDDLVGARYNRTTGGFFQAPTFKEKTAGFTLGGPIVKDRLFFFASYEEYTSSKASPTFGPQGSDLTNVGITQSAIDAAIAAARTTWNIDAGSSAIPQGLRTIVKDTLVKIDWNITDDQRASLRYTRTKQNEPTLNGFSANGLSLSSWWFDQAKTIDTIVGQWFADWTPTFSTELKASKRDYDSVPTPLNGTRLPSVNLRYSGTPVPTPAGINFNNRTLSFGTENSRHLNVLRTKTDDLYGGATWTLGANEFKVGADYSKNEIYNAFLQNIFGNYTFACEPGTYSFGTITNCNATTVTQAQRDQATLENFQRGVPSSYTLQAALPNRTINDGVATWSYENTGVFVQDTLRLSKALNLMFGVRLDQMKVPTKPIANAAAAAPRVAGTVTGANTVTRDTGGFGYDNTRTLDGTDLVQPRFGFNWRLPFIERPTQLRGGFGLFQGAAANVWLSNPFSNSGAAVTTFSCTTFQACNGNTNSTSTLAPLFNANPDAQRAPAGTPPGANVDFLSPNVKQPSVWKANLGFDMELPEAPVVGRLVAGVEWLHTKTKDGIYYRHLNLGDPTRTGSDGRQLFWMPQSYDPACWSGSNLLTGGACSGGRDRALSNAGFGRNVLLAENTSKGGGDSITLSLTMPTGPMGVNWGVNYTRTTAKEVSPLTSSTSSSNWSNRNIFNPNEEVLQNSNYLIRDRVGANVGWSQPVFDSKLRTTIGMSYEGRRGKPYSWTFINDMNGDGISGNDLMYIPRGPGSGEVVFRGGATEEAQFWQIVESDPGLRGSKGSVAGRNTNYAPWVNLLNLRVAQELPGFTSKHKASITLDILNLGNLLNGKWGHIDEIDFPSSRNFVNYNGIDSQGRYVYSLGSTKDFTTRQVSGESQWAAQITLRYEF